MSKNRPRVLITGAASGIGKAVAIRFASEGYDVWLNDLQGEKLKELLPELLPGEHHLLEGSYCDPVFIKKAGEELEEGGSSLDVLVNCAGLFGKSDPFAQEINQWKKVFDIMINGCILISQLAVKYMKTGSRIIHITSIHGDHAEKSASSYSMAKAAINQYCRSAAIELADRNILVNAIAPGFVNTAMSIVDGQNELESPWFLENYVNSHHLPLKRAAEPREIAGVAFFLAGTDASYITGQVIVVDGGLTITF